MSFTQQLDIFLNEYETKHNIRQIGEDGDTDQISGELFNPDTSAYYNKYEDLNESEAKIWETAKSIKRSNPSYLTVVKVLRELQTESRNLKTENERISAKPSLTSLSSAEELGSVEESRTDLTRQSSIDFFGLTSSYKLKKTRDVPTTYTYDQQQQYKEEMNIHKADKSDMVEPTSRRKRYDQTTKQIPIVVIQESTNMTDFTPVKNHPLPSLARVDNHIKAPGFNRHHSCIDKSQNNRPEEVIDSSKLQKLAQPKKEAKVRKTHYTNSTDNDSRISDNNDKSLGHGDTTCGLSGRIPNGTDDTGEDFRSLLTGLLDHSKTVVMKIFKVSKDDEDSHNQSQPQQQLHFVRNSTQDFQIGSVFGVPFIPGISNLPRPSYIKPQ